MNRRRSVPPRQARVPKAPPAGNPSPRQQRRGGFLERFRVPEGVSTRAAAAAPTQPRRSRSRRQARTPLTGWQIATIIVMALLGLALVGSTFIPYLPGFF